MRRARGFGGLHARGVAVAERRGADDDRGRGQRPTATGATIMRARAHPPATIAAAATMQAPRAFDKREPAPAASLHFGK